MAGVPPEETAPTATPQQEPQGETTPTTAAQAAQFVTRQDVLDIFHQVEKEIIDLRGDFSRFVQADREIRRSDETQRNRDRQDWESALATLAAAQQQRDTRLENLLCTVSNRLDAIEAAQRSPPVCIAAPVPVAVASGTRLRRKRKILLAVCAVLGGFSFFWMMATDIANWVSPHGHNTVPCSSTS